MRKWLPPTVLVALLAVTAFADRVIKGSGTRVYVQDGGNAYAIPDAKTFECLGYQWPKIVTVADGEIAKLKQGTMLPSLEDGKLVKGSDARVYLVSGCTRRWIPDAETFEKMGLSWGAIQQIPDWALKQVKDGPQYESAITVVQGKGSEVSDKYQKTECVFTRPHIVLDNRAGRDVTFRLTGAFRWMDHEGQCTPLGKNGDTLNFQVPKGKECKIVMSQTEGGGIKKVEVLDGKTYYVDGNWPVFSCCRKGARDTNYSKELGFGTIQDAIMDRNASTAWRAYKAIYTSAGLRVISRDKDSDVPYSAKQGWDGLPYRQGACVADDK